MPVETSPILSLLTMINSTKMAVLQNPKVGTKLTLSTNKYSGFTVTGSKLTADWTYNKSRECLFILQPSKFQLI